MGLLLGTLVAVQYSMLIFLDVFELGLTARSRYVFILVHFDRVVPKLPVTTARARPGTPCGVLKDSGIDSER